MRDTRKIITFALIGSVIAVILALTGCDWNNGATVCSGGKCATVSPNHHSHTATPVTTVTATATPVIPGATAPAPDAADAVFICLGQDPTRENLDALADNPTAAEDLATCLQVPDDQVEVFAVIVGRDARHARHDGDFSSDSRRHDFAAQTLASDAQHCHAGQAS